MCIRDRLLGAGWLLLFLDAFARSGRNGRDLADRWRSRGRRIDAERDCLRPCTAQHRGPPHPLGRHSGPGIGCRHHAGGSFNRAGEPDADWNGRVGDRLRGSVLGLDPNDHAACGSARKGRAAVRVLCRGLSILQPAGHRDGTGCAACRPADCRGCLRLGCHRAGDRVVDRDVAPATVPTVKGLHSERSRLLSFSDTDRGEVLHGWSGRVGTYGTPSMAGRLNPIAIHAPSNFSMNFPEWPG